MKICKTNAMRLWSERYGEAMFAEDFHGNLMCRKGYGNNNYYIKNRGEKVYCGWNLHHILPLAHGGTNEKKNLLCTSIYTNQEADDKITYWIDDYLYQVQKNPNSDEYQIVRIR